MFQTPDKFNSVVDFSHQGKNQVIFGFQIGEKSFFAATLKKQNIVVVSDFITANAYKTQINSMGKKAEIVSGGISSPVFVFSQDFAQIKNMIKAICDFKAGKLDTLILMPDALTQKLPNLENFETISFSLSDEVDLKQIANKLLLFGYTRQDVVNGEGQFSVRGDVLDVFGVGDSNPTRISMGFDEVEKIYSFTLDEVKKIEDFENLTVYPNTIYFRDNPYEIIDSVQDYQREAGIRGEARLKSDEIFDQVVGQIEKNPNNLNLAFSNVFDEGLNKNILSLFEHAIVIIDEPKQIVQMLDLIYSSYASNALSLIQVGDLTEKHYDYLFERQSLFPKNMASVTFSNISNQTSIYTPQKATSFSCFAPTKYLLNYKSLVSDVKIYNLSSKKVVLFAGDKIAKERLSHLLVENAITPADELDWQNKKQGVFVIGQEMAYSVAIEDTNTVLIGTSDLVKKQAKLITDKRKSVFYLPKIGEYVVHEFYGVGKCVAIERLKLSNYEKDYFVLEYASGDRIYIPTEQANTISAFVGADSEPKLNKLGGLEFSKIKARAKKSIEALAINLIELYKQRESKKGFVFENDSYLQTAFEDAFPYEETPDQMQAIIETKNDMASEKIMDRLICGDVGYGKTEIALRAAYKAVLSGKQVAILCPTTILSQQHFKTCKKRFKDFMVNIEVVNRLVPLSKQKGVLKRAKEGGVDILIGTHRLLAKDIEFKDLGLLILDEEQRFGVQDKEKIKDIKKNIDVLTLSATPIPRTLHMSLSGIRDISIIETPPKNRIPVQTFVCEYDEAIIQTAVSKELARGGQAYIVYNRVETIFDFKRKIESLFPDVKIGVAHGRMSRKELEDTVLNLYNGAYQILIATTLIENGIDIETANTMIVVDADRLGLSSLYQLKGRVGRSNKIAYAYFTYKKDKVLTQSAFKRLGAITEFTSLGSGFKIAMRDLEIRGAGSVLGNKQHGHIEKVGYDLYCKLLDEAISELRGEKQDKHRDVKVDVKISAFIPKEYVLDENQRIKIYTNISNVKTIEEKENMLKNFEQSYGEVPKEVVNLLDIAIIKNNAKLHDVKTILINNEKCQMQLYKKAEIIDEYLAKSIEKHKDLVVLKFGIFPTIDFENKGSKIQSKLQDVLNFFIN